jgi:hypothetical protein
MITVGSPVLRSPCLPHLSNSACHRRAYCLLSSSVYRHAFKCHHVLNVSIFTARFAVILVVVHKSIADPAFYYDNDPDPDMTI